MDTTIQISLPQCDANFLRRLSRNMGWKITSVDRKQNKQAVKMTEEEFRAKLEKSSIQAQTGDVIRMRPEETGKDFINRLLCMQ